MCAMLSWNGVRKLFARQQTMIAVQMHITPRVLFCVTEDEAAEIVQNMACVCLLLVLFPG